MIKTNCTELQKMLKKGLTKDCGSVIIQKLSDERAKADRKTDRKKFEKNLKKVLDKPKRV